MCTESAKIDRLEVGMNSLGNRVSVVETKLDNVIDSLKEMQQERRSEIDKIIQVLEEAKKEAVQETKSIEQGIKAKKWAIIMTIIAVGMSAVTTALLSVLANK